MNSCSFISNQMTFTMSSGKMHGLFLPSGKSYHFLYCVSFVLSGLPLKTQCGKFRHTVSLPALLPVYIISSSMFLRYAYSEDAHEEFDKDDTNLTLIRPSPISSPSKDVRTVPDVKPLRGSDNPVGDLEEDKTA